MVTIVGQSPDGSVTHYQAAEVDIARCPFCGTSFIICNLTPEGFGDHICESCHSGIYIHRYVDAR